ncbi:MAG: hypothetical protein HQK51_03055 [Oligoflexia bacterium]|nr:hypothetical protein [Oligoflexia bacterium]
MQNQSKNQNKNYNQNENYFKFKFKFVFMSMITLFIFVLSSLALHAAIIGEDDRVATNDYELTKKVGSILYQGRAICTAFASSKNHVTTAAGCVDEQNLRDYTFAFSDKKERKIQKLRINKKTKLAVMFVDGINEFFSSSKLEDGRQIVSVVTYRDSDNSIVKSEIGEVWFTPVSGLFYHTHSTDLGSAGAPILQNGKIVAVHLGIAKYKKYAENTRADSHATLSLKENINYNTAVRVSDVKDIDLENVAINYEKAVQ